MHLCGLQQIPAISDHGLSGAPKPTTLGHLAVTAIVPHPSAGELPGFTSELADYQNTAPQTEQYFFRLTNPVNILQMHDLRNAVLPLHTFRAGSGYSPWDLKSPGWLQARAGLIPSPQPSPAELWAGQGSQHASSPSVLGVIGKP